jgi:hypothetical protein
MKKRKEPRRVDDAVIPGVTAPQVARAHSRPGAPCRASQRYLFPLHLTSHFLTPRALNFGELHTSKIVL